MKVSRMGDLSEGKSRALFASDRPKSARSGAYVRRWRRNPPIAPPPRARRARHFAGRRRTSDGDGSDRGAASSWFPLRAAHGAVAGERVQHVAELVANEAGD